MRPANCLTVRSGMPDNHNEPGCADSGCEPRYHLSTDSTMCNANTYMRPANCLTVRPGMPDNHNEPGCADSGCESPLSSFY